jgi:hypothetical protein
MRYIDYSCSVPDQGVLGPVLPGERDLTSRHPSGAALKMEGAGMSAYGQVIWGLQRVASEPPRAPGCYTIKKILM